VSGAGSSCPCTEPEALQLEALAHWLAICEPLDDGELAAVLARRLRHRSPHRSSSEAADNVREALRDHPEPFGAIEKISRRFMTWRDGAPALVVDPALWPLRSLIDQDLLLAAWVAWQGEEDRPGKRAKPPNPQQLARDPVAPALDQDLAERLDKPLAETHLHLWGAAPPLIDWLALMLDLASLADKSKSLAKATQEEEEEGVGDLAKLRRSWVERLAEAALLRIWLAAAVRDLTAGPHPFRRVGGLPRAVDLEVPAERGERPDERRTATLLARWRSALTAVGYRRPPDPDAVAIPGCPVWVDAAGRCPFRDPLSQAVLLDLGSVPPLGAFALGERFLLASALRLARPPVMVTGAVAPGAAGIRQALPERLLRYVRTKSACVRLLSHRHGARGLDPFQSSFARRNVRWRGSNHRARRVWHLAMERYWTETVALRWLQASTTLPLLPGVEGSLPRLSARSGLPDLERKLELRITPALASSFGPTVHAQAQGLHHAFAVLSRAVHRQASRSAVVAGGTALPRFQVGFVFHLRKSRETDPDRHAHGVRQILAWLRDHPGYQEIVVGLDAAGGELDQPPADFVPAFHVVWSELARPAGSTLKLGMTFHVGEDFLDLLTGIRQVDLVVALLRLRPGDRIGHALALGLDPQLWYERLGGRSQTRIGDHLLDLLWARHRLRRASPADDRLLRQLESLLADLAVHDLERAQDAVSDWLERPWEPGLTFERERALQGRLMSYFRPATHQDKPHGVKVTQDWLAIVSKLQATVASTVEQAGICIEANPSSNLAIAGLTRIEQLPIFRQRRIGAGAAGSLPLLKVSISTDDPGLFHTGLREEYDLLLASALASGYPRHEVLDWLDRIREIGYESSFLRGRAAPGKHSLEFLQRLTGRVVRRPQSSS
jgi:hypothetical protein